MASWRWPLIKGVGMTGAGIAGGTAATLDAYRDEPWVGDLRELLHPDPRNRMGSTVEPSAYDEGPAAAQSAREMAARRVRGELAPSVAVERRFGEFAPLSPPAPPTRADAYRMGGIADMSEYQEAPRDFYKKLDVAGAERDVAPDPQMNLFAASPQQTRVGKAAATVPDALLIPTSPVDLALMSLGPAGKIAGVPGKVAAMTAGLMASGIDPAEAGISAQAAKAMRRARRERLMGGAFEGVEQELYNPRAVIGGNMPPEGMRISPELPPAIAEASPAAQAAAIPLDIAAAPPKSWNASLPRPRPAATSTAIPDIRNMPVADAIAIARTQPHLIEAGEGSAGKYVGGPHDIQSKQALNAQRRRFDEMVASDPRGGDWYDRYRAGQNVTTGGDPVQNLWQSAQHGQFSAGVSPEHELNLALKENNASIAGMPYKAGTPAQHEAHLRALAAKDPMLYQLGEKTGEYQVKVDPTQPGVPAGGTATGVNDFRQGNVHGYPEGWDKAFTSAQHKYLDYETALAVDRANQAQLGGRSDWTGEKLQAIPWVIDKARALMSRNAELTYEQAMQLALKTVVDFYPKHTYFATHEAQPGANVVGHMAQSVNAPQSVRDQFALDPQSSWANAPMGRDAIYAGLGVEGTGNYMRVLPSIPMQGVYDTPAGNTEFNLGQVARPLGAFQAPARDPETKKVIDKTAPFKRVADAEETILNAGEALRGYIDAQNVSTWHKHWAGGPNKESGSLFIPRDGPASQADVLALRNIASQYGLGDVVDTGRGLTVTSFGNMPADNKALDKALKAGVFDQFGPQMRTRLDTGYIDYVGKFDQAGSGEATRHMLEYVNKTPELRDAFNRNQYVGQNALARMERDEKWAARWGSPREDIQKAREIISQGPGWVDRLEEALRAGVLLPATVAAIFAGATAVPRGGSNDGS